MSRAVRHDPPPPRTDTRDENEPRTEKTREERFAEARAKILQDYAETFRRLSQ